MHVQIRDNSNVLSTDVWHYTSTVSRSIATYVGERRTSICTIVWHKLGKVGAIYWSIVMYINGRQMCVLTFARQRKWCIWYCYTESRVVRCHCSEYRRTGYWNIYSMVTLTIWWTAVKTCHGQMSSLLCRNYSMCKKKVSGTKMIIFENCERFREMRGNESRGVYQRRICYTPCIAELSFCTTT
jgi:hypothetical protein